MAESREFTLAFVRSHPGEAARVLEQLPPADAAALLAEVPAGIACGLVARLLPAFAARSLALLPRERVVRLLRGAGAPSSAAILRHAPGAWRAAVLGALPTPTALACRLLLRFPEDTVGALADVEVPTFSPATTVREVLALLKNREDDAGDFIYVLDADRRLRACIRPRALLHASGTLPIGEAPSVDLPTLPATATVSSVRGHDGWNAHSTLPVVDRGRRFVGALRQAALARAISRRSAGPAPEGVLELLAESGWSAFSGLLDAAVGILPGRARGARE